MSPPQQVEPITGAGEYIAGAGALMIGALTAGAQHGAAAGAGAGAAAQQGSGAGAGASQHGAGAGAAHGAGAGAGHAAGAGQGAGHGSGSGAPQQSLAALRAARAAFRSACFAFKCVNRPPPHLPAHPPHSGSGAGGGGGGAGPPQPPHAPAQPRRNNRPLASFSPPSSVSPTTVRNAAIPNIKLRFIEILPCLF